MNSRVRDDARPWWFCTYGTVSFLIKAQTAEAAEQKVRTDVLADNATIYQVTSAVVRRHGEILVRLATDEDKARHAEIKRAERERA